LHFFFEVDLKIRDFQKFFIEDFFDRSNLLFASCLDSNAQHSSRQIKNNYARNKRSNKKKSRKKPCLTARQEYTGHFFHSP